MRIGELVGSGRTADVYAIDERWVLRRYRDGTDQTREAAVLAHLAERGYPVPAVDPASDAGRGLVMQRLYGPTSGTFEDHTLRTRRSMVPMSPTGMYG